MTIKVAIADDHSLVRQGLRRYLDMADGIEVVGEAADGKELLGGVGVSGAASADDAACALARLADACAAAA